MSAQGVRLLTAADAMAYALAGNATLILGSAASGTHYTYLIAVASRPGVHFVKLDAGGVPEYLGVIDAAGFRLTAASANPTGSGPVKAFNYFWGHLLQGRIAPELEVSHAGRCGVCCRKLTTPASVVSGIGPECARRRLRAA